MNNSFVSASDALIPAGIQQTFTVPAGATALLLGIGADNNLSDNSGTFTVHITLPSGAFGPGSITPKPLTAGIVGNPTKIYDGTSTAILTPANFSLSGLVGSDSFTVNQTVGAYNSKDVTATTVSANLGAANFTPGAGTLASNYILPLSGPSSTDVTVTVPGTQTYYDGSNGTLALPVALPQGVTQVQFRATGGTSPIGSTLYSPDGLDSSGNISGFQFTNNRFSGTYQGTSIGGTTGLDPALFGVFFSPTFSGTPADSVNYRTDSGITPDPRTLATYAPALNQPFFIGDGYNLNNKLISTSDSLIPAGNQQTFTVPAGATELLLGIGADNNLSDNSGSFTVHITLPSTATTTLSGPGTITPKTLTVTGLTAINKIYDATTIATLNTAAAGSLGVIGTDVVTLVTSGAVGTFTNPGPGTGIAVTVSGLTLTGAQAADYQLPMPQFTTTANITPVTSPTSAVLPGVIIGNKSALEGDAIVFQVTLTSASSTPVNYDVFTTNGSAVAGMNFTGIKVGDNNAPFDVGTLTIPAGLTKGTIIVKTTPGASPAGGPAKSFTVSVADPSNPNRLLAIATGSIVAPSSATNVQSAGIVIGNQYAVAGPQGGLQLMTFHLVLSSVPNTPVTYDFFLTSGTAASGINYVSPQPNNIGTVTFAAGDAKATIIVEIIGGSLPANVGSETFTISISNPLDPAVALASATGTIEAQ